MNYLWSTRLNSCVRKIFYNVQVIAVYFTFLIFYSPSLEVGIIFSKFKYKFSIIRCLFTEYKINFFLWTKPYPIIHLCFACKLCSAVKNRLLNNMFCIFSFKVRRQKCLKVSERAKNWTVGYEIERQWESERRKVFTSSDDDQSVTLVPSPSFCLGTNSIRNKIHRQFGQIYGTQSALCVLNAYWTLPVVCWLIWTDRDILIQMSMKTPSYLLNFIFLNFSWLI